MRSLASALAVVLAFGALAAGCPNNLATVCDLPNEAPDVPDGRGTATRSDGEAFNEVASWAPGANASVTIGLLDMIVVKDELGADFDVLVGDGALPICVRLGERGDKTGLADFGESPSYITDATHTGSVALLSLEGDVLTGRFVADVASPGGPELSFTDGAFSAHRR